MQSKKKLINSFMILIILVLVNIPFVIHVFAIKYDEDLSNLSATTSVTLKIGDNDYTINNDTDIDGLISLDMAILEYKANNGTIDYSTSYNQLLGLLEKNATIITGDIVEQTISSDTIWNITGNANMMGNVNIGTNARLIIMGDGIISRNGDYSIINYGKISLQESVTADGGGEQNNARFIKSEGSNLLKAKLYLTDNFKIQNFVVNNTDGVGIYGSQTLFYMSGGTIGSKNITFRWDDGNETLYGINTEEYLSKREQKNEYPYIKEINTINGNIGKHVTGGDVPMGGGIYLEGSEFYMSDGSIVGNSLIGTSTNPVNGAGSHGGAGYFLQCNIYITGGKISGNQTNIAKGATSTYNQYSGAIQLAYTSGKYICEMSNVEIAYNYTQRWVGAIDIYSGNTLYLKENAIIKYNQAANNSGAIAVDGTGAYMVMENGSKVTHNYSGNLGGGIRCLGQLTMNGGDISYNYSVNDAAGLSIQTDDSRTGKAVLNGGSIKNNKSEKSGGGIGIVVARKNGTSGLTLNGTDIHSNIADGYGGGIYVDASNGIVIAELDKGLITENTAYAGAGIYVNQRYVCEATLNISSDDVKIQKNNAQTDGGGIYLYHDTNNTGTIEAVINGGFISENVSNGNGGGLYLNNGSLNILKGTITGNISKKDGAGAYVYDGIINMSGGNIEKNTSVGNGAGIYSRANITMNDGNVKYNKSTNGNGGGIYLDNNSNFKFINGKVVYNSVTSTETPTEGTLAKNSTSGVGGGVYINSGVFSMYDDNNNAGTGAIYGNTADYSADDLFATGDDTQFDAISVIEMKKSDEYMTSDSWFEDYPENEEHLSLNEANRISIKSKGRYKILEKNDSVDDMVAATTVLKRNCTDYIAITMGKGLGGISLEVNDTNIQSDQTFIYKLEYVKVYNNDTGELSMILSADCSKSTIVNKIPAGTYKLTLIPNWSWRYNDTTNVKITANNISKELETNTFEFNVYSNQITKCITSYSLKSNNSFFTKLLTIVKGVK